MHTSPSSHHSHHHSKKKKKHRRQRQEGTPSSSSSEAEQQARRALIHHAHTLVHSAPPAHSPPAQLQADINTCIALLVHLSTPPSPLPSSSTSSNHHHASDDEAAAAAANATSLLLFNHALRAASALLRLKQPLASAQLGTLLAAATRAITDRASLFDAVLAFTATIQPGVARIEQQQPSSSSSSSNNSHVLLRRVLPALIIAFGKTGSPQLGEKLIFQSQSSSSSTEQNEGEQLLLLLSNVLRSISKHAPKTRPPVQDRQAAAAHTALEALALAEERRRILAKHHSSSSSSSSTTTPSSPPPPPFPNIAHFRLGPWSAEPAIWAALVTARLLAGDEAGAEIWLHFYRALLNHRKWLLLQRQQQQQQQQPEAQASAEDEAKAILIDALPFPSALPYHARIQTRPHRQSHIPSRALAHVRHKIASARRVDPHLVRPYQTEIIRETLLQMKHDGVQPDPVLYNFLIAFEAMCRRVRSAADLVEAQLRQILTLLLSKHHHHAAAAAPPPEQPKDDGHSHGVALADVLRHLGPGFLSSLAEIHIQRSKTALLASEQSWADAHAHHAQDGEHDEEAEEGRRRRALLEEDLFDRERHPLARLVCGQTPGDMLAAWLEIHDVEPLASSTLSPAPAPAPAPADAGAALGSAAHEGGSELEQDGEEEDEDDDGDGDVEISDNMIDHDEDETEVTSSSSSSSSSTLEDDDDDDASAPPPPILNQLYSRGPTTTAAATATATSHAASATARHPPLRSGQWLQRYVHSLLRAPAMQYPHALLLMQALQRRSVPAQAEPEPEPEARQGGSKSGAGAGAGLGSEMHVVSAGFVSDVLSDLLRVGHAHVMRHFHEGAGPEGEGGPAYEAAAAAERFPSAPQDGVRPEAAMAGPRGRGKATVTFEQAENEQASVSTVTLERAVPVPSFSSPEHEEQEHEQDPAAPAPASASGPASLHSALHSATHTTHILRLLRSATLAELKFSHAELMDLIASTPGREGNVDEETVRDGEAFVRAVKVGLLGPEEAQGQGRTVGEMMQLRAGWCQTLLLDRDGRSPSASSPEEEEARRASAEARLRTCALLMSEGLLENAYNSTGGASLPDELLLLSLQRRPQFDEEGRESALQAVLDHVRARTEARRKVLRERCVPPPPSLPMRPPQAEAEAAGAGAEGVDAQADAQAQAQAEAQAEKARERMRAVWGVVLDGFHPGAGAGAGAGGTTTAEMGSSGGAGAGAGAGGWGRSVVSHPDRKRTQDAPLL
ncbi:hypothetical protein OC835_000909 [Tilletia horrida]|nr:hypothetical protein OC835_000909 [Tilletia horrida]